MDEIDKPLGQTAAKPRPAWLARLLKIRPRHILASVAVLCLLGFAGAAMLIDDPLGGQPRATVKLDPVKPAPEAPAVPKVVVAAPSAPERAPGTQTITVTDGVTGEKKEIVVGATEPKPGQPPAGAIIPAGTPAALVEQTRFGPLPRIAPDGTRPADFYARREGIPAGHPPGTGKVAIVVTGIGIASGATAEALKLPPAVTLALSPYPADIAGLATRARANGREILLQIPMEPIGYPDNDPGPQTLLANVEGDVNLERLHWSLGRFTGYVGIVNLMGARFGTSEPAVQGLARELAKRGLLLLDDGGNPQSRLQPVAQTARVPTAKADFVLDASPTVDAIDAALARLETFAKDKGMAVAVINAGNLGMERLALWIREATRRGILLVPISAAVHRPNQS